MNKTFCQKSSFKLHNSLNNFCKDPPQEYIWGSKFDVYFQMRWRLKLLNFHSHVVPRYLTGKKCQKPKI